MDSVGSAKRDLVSDRSVGQNLDVVTDVGAEPARRSERGGRTVHTGAGECQAIDGAVARCAKLGCGPSQRGDPERIRTDTARRL
jgi:hypothetical protein